MSTARTVPRLINFLSTVSGADKAYRISTYSIRIILWYLIKTRGANAPLVAKLQNLATPLADTRYVLRLFDLLSMYEEVRAIKSEYKTNEAKHVSYPKDVLDWIRVLQCGSMLAYYPLEHIWWLAAHKVLDVKSEKADQISRWSCQAWGAWILLDIVATVYKLQPKWERLKEFQAALRSKTNPDQDKTKVKAELKALRGEMYDLVLRLIAMCGDFPLAIHWSMKSYPLSNLAVGVLGFISSVAYISVKWKYTS